MGFRFSKRITIVPGVRLNISGSGISTSVGPRGLSLTMGKRGTYLNAGLPGTGLSYRERLDRPSRRSTAQPTPEAPGYDGPIKVKVDDDGSLIITDLDDNALPAAIVKRVKQEKAEDIQDLLEAAAAKVNQALEECLGVHMDTPHPGSLPALPPPFAQEEPRRPVADSPGLLDKMLLRGPRWNGKPKSARPSTSRISLNGSLPVTLTNKPERISRRQSAWQQKGSAPTWSVLSTTCSLELPGRKRPWSSTSSLTTSPALRWTWTSPTKAMCPAGQQRGKGNGKLTFKNRSEAQTRRDYVTLCYGTIFRVVGEVFALLPGIQNCLVSGYIQRTSAATGRVEDQYVISALVSREQWETIDHSRLAIVDPGAALKSFGAVVKLDRSSRFTEIEPLDMEALG